jgi:hypothetical protein
MHVILLMAKEVSQNHPYEQPIRWSRAIGVGILSVCFMMGFVDIFYLMGFTPFSYEIYLGSLIFGNPYSGHVWIVGFFENLIFGALFGIFYSYCFEYIFRRSSVRLGIWVGFCHSVVAAVIFFPFFNVIHDFIGTGLFESFGFFGSGLGLATSCFLLVGHLLFGASMGLLYGPVWEVRVRSGDFEPGDVNVEEGWERISKDDDPEDRAAGY